MISQRLRDWQETRAVIETMEMCMNGNLDHDQLCKIYELRVDTAIEQYRKLTLDDKRQLRKEAKDAVKN